MQRLRRQRRGGGREDFLVCFAERARQQAGRVCLDVVEAVEGDVGRGGQRSTLPQPVGSWPTNPVVGS
jgi:hypothetical protein